MKLPNALLTTILTLLSASAMAHVGPDALDEHFIEHLVLALVIGIPMGYGLLRLAAQTFKQDQQR